MSTIKLQQFSPFAKFSRRYHYCPIKVVELQPLDRILLCTDGLYRAVDEDALLHVLQCAKDVEQVVDKYRAICAEKADDNYTAIIIEME